MSDPGDDPILYNPASGALQTPRGSGGSGQLSFGGSTMSMSPSLCSGGGGGGGGSSSGGGNSSSTSTSSSKSAVSECLSAWLNYFQILNGLCSSGYRLAQTIATLEQQCGADNQHQAHSAAAAASAAAATATGTQQPSATAGAGVTQYVTAWDDLARATAVATSTVKSHIVNVLQDFVTATYQPPSHSAHIVDQMLSVGGGTATTAVALCTGSQSTTAPAATAAAVDPLEAQRIREHNQQLLVETTQTMINIQHQFCVASYESFSTSMCCFVCQAPVGCPHDDGCAMLRQSASGCVTVAQSSTGGQQSQQQQQQQQQSPKFTPTHMRPTGSLFASSGCPSAQASNEYIPYAIPDVAQSLVRGPSPPIHLHALSHSHQQQQQSHQFHLQQHAHNTFFDTVRGPLPNPGNLLGQKAPFVHRGGSRSPLNCPLFPLSTQRRWSEAAAGSTGADAGGTGYVYGGVYGGFGGGTAGGAGGGGGAAGTMGGAGGVGGGGDADGSMRRWSMPYDAAGPGRVVAGSALHQPNTVVAWHQTRVGPVMSGGAGSRFGAMGGGTASQSSSGKSTGDRSHSITPDSVWHSGPESDGLAEAIQLLTLRATRPAMASAYPAVPPPSIGAPFIEESSSQSFFTSPDAAPVYEMWPDSPQIMPCIKFNQDHQDDGHQHRKG